VSKGSVELNRFKSGGLMTTAFALYQETAIEPLTSGERPT
jgi:hypothetical protein